MVNLTRREKEKMAHETDIIDAAESVFIRNGFDGTSIDEIASEAKFTRRTVYQYFKTKEELYFEVAVRNFLKLSSYLESEPAKEDSTGYEDVRRSGLAFYRFYLDSPDAIRLMNYVGYIKETAKSSPRYQRFLEANHVIFQNIAKSIEKGQADGSIRGDFSAVEKAFSLAFLITSFFHELSTNGNSFTAFINISEERFVVSTLDLIFQAIKA